MLKSACNANVRGDRIQLLIREDEPGYDAFKKVLAAISMDGFMSWYGDVRDNDGKEQCGLIITTHSQNKKRWQQCRKKDDSKSHASRAL